MRAPLGRPDRLTIRKVRYEEGVLLVDLRSISSLHRPGRGSAASRRVQRAHMRKGLYTREQTRSPTGTLLSSENLSGA
jgi:hypothetical protein